MVARHTGTDSLFTLAEFRLVDLSQSRFWNIRRAFPSFPQFSWELNHLLTCFFWMFATEYNFLPSVTLQHTMDLLFSTPVINSGLILLGNLFNIYTPLFPSFFKGGQYRCAAFASTLIFRRFSLYWFLEIASSLCSLYFVTNWLTYTLQYPVAWDTSSAPRPFARISNANQELNKRATAYERRYRETDLTKSGPKKRIAGWWGDWASWKSTQPADDWKWQKRRKYRWRSGHRPFAPFSGGKQH